MIDTNVLLSSLRSRHGASFHRLQKLGSPAFQPVISPPLCLEYEDVLSRPGLLAHYSAQDVSDFLDYFLSQCVECQIHFLWRPHLPDPKDDLLLELALAGNAPFIITHNLREDITSIYRPGRMEWKIQDGDWGNTVVHLETVPAANGPGMALRLRMENAQPGDKIVWASGGAMIGKARFLWQYDLISQNTDLRTRGFVPADCEGERVEINDGAWVLTANGEKSGMTATGRCSVPATISGRLGPCVDQDA